MRYLSILSAALCVVSVGIGASAIWSTWWLVSSVGAMTEDFEREGIVDASRAAAYRRSGPAYSSTGAFLMQGHDQSAAIRVYLLTGLAVLGFGTISAMAYRMRRVAEGHSQGSGAQGAKMKSGGA